MKGGHLVFGSFRQTLGTTGGLSRIWERMSSPVKWLLGIILGMVILFGATILTVGIFIGGMTVAGMWITVDQIPGVRALGRTSGGVIILSVLASLLVHLIIGTATVTGMVAAASALVIKWMLLTAEAGEHRPQKTSFSLEGRANRRDALFNPPVLDLQFQRV